MDFYLGTWQPKHIERTKHPLMISFRWIKNRRKPIEQKAPLALDSGGFTELEKNGEWITTPEEYVQTIRRLSDEIGLTFDFIAPQDWMCEPHMVEKTGLTVREHQRLTVDNYLKLKEMAPELPFMPVLQGYSMEEYEECYQMYQDSGVNLIAEPLVGIGSVCRRESTKEIAEIIRRFSPLNLHAFGVKKGGLINSGDYLTSADSMAWSVGARRSENFCANLSSCASSCRNCLNYALGWSKRIGVVQ